MPPGRSTQLIKGGGEGESMAWAGEGRQGLMRQRIVRLYAPIPVRRPTAHRVVSAPWRRVALWERAPV